MDESLINSVIINYEEKLKRDEPTFKLTPFEKILLKEGIIYGYEYRKNQELDNSR
jgi:hypothetical protein